MPCNAETVAEVSAFLALVLGTLASYGVYVVVTEGWDAYVALVANWTWLIALIVALVAYVIASLHS